MSRRCPDCDPILRAGHLTCHGCGAVSWPADAAWVTGSLILAVYNRVHEPGCTHRPGHAAVVLIDMTAETNDIPSVPRPRLCRGVNRAGRPCRHTARPGSAYCSWHDTADPLTSNQDPR